MIKVLVAKQQLLTTLHLLDLTGSQISDEGLLLLMALPSLRKLVLRRTAETNVGLQVLIALPNLEQVFMGRTRATWLGRLKLRKALRNVKIAK